MKKIMLIGHRGVGKSKVLNRLQAELKEVLFFSLDDEVEKHTGVSIPEIFEKSGEVQFRDYEKKVFHDLQERYADQSMVVDVGAGFLGEKPKGWQAVWIQREVDPANFQFLNRPNLDQGLQMSAERFEKRQERYAMMADTSLVLIEGDYHNADFEKKWFSALFNDEALTRKSGNWLITLLNGDYVQFHSQSSILENYQYELRDDLLSCEQIETVLANKPRSLISFRDKDAKTQKLLSDDSFWDWPLEWGENSEASILSLHKRKESLDETLLSLPTTDQIIKLAIPIRSFAELERAYNWQQESSSSRVFLPSSSDGQWSWFRLLTATHMPFSFVREAEGSSCDQPTLNELMLFNEDFKKSAAILGDPVKHSLTPSFHHQYFADHKMNILKVSIKEKEFAAALPFLKKLGLTAAAVTSPLKKVASDQVNSNYEAINTLCLCENQWKGTNTDIDGLKALSHLIGQRLVAVWGGGGTHQAIEKVLPEANYYSSRTGELKKGEAMKSGPEVVIWAVGAKNFTKQGVFPPAEWVPQLVIDLNYTQDSPGIQCADNYGCQYQSGLVMFTAQADKQQEFWNECGLE